MSAIDFIKDNIDVKINNIDIDKSQRIQCYDKAKKIERLNIIKFVKCNVRGKTFWKKRKLKSTEKMFRTSHTTKMIGQLHEAWG